MNWISFLVAASLLTPLTKTEDIAWTPVSATPDSLGLAGVYSGFVDGKLWVAGGANFPEGMPWEGGVKHWSAAVSVYDGTEWTVLGDALPEPLLDPFSDPLFVVELLPAS